MKKGFWIWLVLLTSCSNHTSISYRLREQEELIKEDGFMFSCIVDGNSLIVETFTPESTIPEYYYNELHGKKSTKKIVISDVKLYLTGCSKQLPLTKRPTSENYYYTSINIEHIVDKNEHIQISFYVTNLQNGKREKKQYILKRVEETYSTGTLPHS